MPEQVKAGPEFTFGDDDSDDDVVRARVLRQQARGLARQAAMDTDQALVEIVVLGAGDVRGIRSRG